MEDLTLNNIQDCDELGDLLIGLGRFAEVIAPILIGIGAIICLSKNTR